MKRIVEFWFLLWGDGGEKRGSANTAPVSVHSSTSGDEVGGNFGYS